MKTILLSLAVLGCSCWSFSQDTLRHIGKDEPLTTYYEYDVFQNFCGYTIGQSCNFFEAFGERYTISDSAEVISILSYHTGHIKSLNRQVSFDVYSVGANKMPGQVLGSRSQSYRNLFVSGNPVSTTFDLPVKVGNSFFVVVDFLEYAHEALTDTIALLSSENGSRPDADLTDLGKNVIRLHHHEFEDLYTKTGLKINLALYPVIQFPVVNGISEQFVTKGNLTLHAPFPNPCNDRLNVRFALLKNSEVKLEVTDAEGRTMISQNLGLQSSGSHTETIDVENLSAGFYLLLLHTERGVLATRFFK